MRYQLDEFFLDLALIWEVFDRLIASIVVFVDKIPSVIQKRK